MKRSLQALLYTALSFVVWFGLLQVVPPNPLVLTAVVISPFPIIGWLATRKPKSTVTRG